VEHDPDMSDEFDFSNGVRGKQAGRIRSRPLSQVAPGKASRGKHANEAQGATMSQAYTVVIERDAESGWLVAEVVELPGCYTQAADLPSLEANVREAIEAYVATMDADEPRPDFVGTWRIQVGV
jgi:predicted RNase H-like HicB family nuclease